MVGLFAIASLFFVQGGLVAEIKAFDKALYDIANTSTTCQILMSIPRFGVQTSAATVDGIDRFK
ncbi:MAG: hypothetical protein AAGA73_01330 [Pseudomonadota bacterium]